MKYIELSLKDVEKESKKLAKIVKKNIEIDLVIFVAKGSYQIGKVISNEFKCPLIEIEATREGNSIKENIKKILRKLPKILKVILRKFELKSNIHSIKNVRKISINEKQWKKYKNCKNILIIDDSIDTGNSMRQVFEYTSSYFKKSNVYTACLNYFEKSLVNFKADFTLYKESILNGPWSNDSKYNDEFLKMYLKFKGEYDNE